MFVFFAQTTTYVFSREVFGVQLEHLFMLIVQNFQILLNQEYLHLSSDLVFCN
jgi:hypothetical protein